MLGLLLVEVPAFSQNKAADKLAKEYRANIENASKLIEVDARIVECMVYPELIRYSIFRDKIEKSMLNGLYVEYGADACDFSIGPFQMKPSFVEKLEKRWNLTDSLSSRAQLYFDASIRTQYSRKERIKRISNIEYQCLYAAIFVKMILYFYPEISLVDTIDQISLISSAYNHGVIWPSNQTNNSTKLFEIIQWTNQKQFHTDIIATPFTKYQSFAKIASSHFDDIK